ncbi:MULTISPECIES: PTS sugar transporter subunit IIA [Enterococcus]|uniref:PTS sugar transporter subunit IIA n=1 Tax=Enterococcus alishanensis TaxID=1303817 RepID=A0ABS6TGP4_9ENTE|nr:PTS sugar transporter subunit IIA [Enterococcus alishanensis]MBV7392147.1 PTS sugar transporter subunit IIA [Enterococcus alishanensis]
MDTLDIKEVVNKNLIITGLEGTDKEAVIRELTKRLHDQGYLSDEETFVQDVLAREKEGITGLGNGIAIPHGKSDGVKITTIAVGTTKSPIEWESLDDEPVNVVILFAVKKTDETTTHIKLLQKVAILLADEDLLTNLRNAQSSDEIFELLTAEEE